MGSFTRGALLKTALDYPREPIINGPDGVDALGFGLPAMGTMEGAVIDEHDTDQAQNLHTEGASPSKPNPERWIEDIISRDRSGHGNQ